MKYTCFICSAFVVQESFSFTPSSSNAFNSQSSSCMTFTASCHGNQNTQLNLVPKQGCQLAAAQTAEFAKKKLENNRDSSSSSSSSPSSSIDHHSQQLSPTDAAREFVSRLFHKPLFGNHKHNNNTTKKPEFQPLQEFKIPGLYDENNYHDSKKDDVVLFPIVGFQYVKLQDGTVRGIPTINASPEKAVCSFESKNKSMNEPLHGWYTQCCFLGDLYADDDEYCGQGRYLKLEEEKGRESEPHISEMLGWYKEYD